MTENKITRAIRRVYRAILDNWLAAWGIEPGEDEVGS